MAWRSLKMQGTICAFATQQAATSIRVKKIFFIVVFCFLVIGFCCKITHFPRFML